MILLFRDKLGRANGDQARASVPRAPGGQLGYRLFVACNQGHDWATLATIVSAPLLTKEQRTMVGGKYHPAKGK